MVLDIPPSIEKNRMALHGRALCILLLIISLAVGITFAEPASRADPYPRSITDDQGIDVTLDHAPERIVSLAPSNTELLFALGLDEKITGVTDYCDYPEKAAGKEKIGGFSTVSLEKVTALEPDLIIAADGNSEDTITRLRELGFPVYFVNAESMDDILKTLENIGYLTGTEKMAETITADLSARAEAVEAEGLTLATHPTVAHVIWNDPIYVSGTNTFQDEVIRLSGGVNVFADKDSHVVAGIEEFVNLDPDIIMFNSGKGMGGSNESELEAYFRSEPRLSKLSAIRDDSVIIVDSSIADRASPRLWDLLEEVAPIIRAEA